MNSIKTYRVLEDRGTTFLVSPDGNEMLTAEISGRLKKTDSLSQPTVGDWVSGSLQPGDWFYIENVEPRTTLLSRQDPGGRSLQKLGANVDYLWIATALNQDFNLNRLDRYVAMSLSCGVIPVIVLTKADLPEDPSVFLDETAERFPGIDIHAVSTTQGWNLDSLLPYLQAEKTVAVMGSSGVGKSTLVNRLLGEEILETGDIREDDGKGRHTTSHRSLHRLPTGAWLMDTPGLRSLALGDTEGVATLFQDIMDFGRQCKFRDCRHENEPGCRVQEALLNSEISLDRWESFQKLRREENYILRKSDPVEAQKEKNRWKSIHKQMRQKKKLQF